MESVHGGVRLIRESEVDLPRGLLVQTWIYYLRDGTREVRRGCTRLYQPHELASMVADAGFSDVELLGSVNGERLELDSPRCIVLARKKSAA
jgi:hypothetical protein